MSVIRKEFVSMNVSIEIQLFICQRKEIRLDLPFMNLDQVTLSSCMWVLFCRF